MVCSGERYNWYKKIACYLKALKKPAYRVKFDISFTILKKLIEIWKQVSNIYKIYSTYIYNLSFERF